MNFSNQDLSDEELDKINKQHWEHLGKQPGGAVSKYPALKGVSGILSFLGYLLLIAGTVIAIYLMSEDNPLAGALVITGSVVLALPLLAFANLIQVLVDIEQNTREMNERMG